MNRFHFIAAIAAASCMILPTAHARMMQESTGAPTQQPPQAQPQEAQPQVDPAKTPEMVGKAKAVAMEVAKAYREAANLSDEILVRTTAPGGTGQDQELSISLGEGTDARLGLGRLRIMCIDQKVYVVNDLITDKYVEMPMNVDLVTTIRAQRGQGFPIPHFGLRRAESIDQVENALTTIAGHGLITGYREVTDDKTGKKLDEILASGPNGNLSIRCAQDTRFLQSMHLVFMPPGGTEPFKADFTFTPTVHDELPEPIAFDPAGREAVGTPAELSRPSLQIGNEFPDLAVTDITGGTHSLADFDEDLEVVIFFTIELIDLETLLDTMQQYSVWVKEEGLSVKIVAVSMMEKNAGEQLKKELGSLWSVGQYSYPVIMDQDDEIAIKYSLMGLPCIMLVDKDGKVGEQFIMILTETTDLKSATRTLLGLEEPEEEAAGAEDDETTDEGGG
ncbi:MAG: redoxin domain-containing protein [Planctomycetes bacterium]|nr:redoxin domain-containing protein [Planctomycetota bacterium]